MLIAVYYSLFLLTVAYRHTYYFLMVAEFCSSKTPVIFTPELESNPNPISLYYITHLRTNLNPMAVPFIPQFASNLNPCADTYIPNFASNLNPLAVSFNMKPNKTQKPMTMNKYFVNSEEYDEDSAYTLLKKLRLLQLRLYRKLMQ